MKREDELEMIDLETEDNAQNKESTGPDSQRETCEEEENSYWEQEERLPVSESKKEAVTGRGMVMDEDTVSGRKSPPTRASTRGIGNVLLLVGMLCLLAGGGIYLKSFLDAERNKREMEALKSLEGETTEIINSEVPNSEAPNGEAPNGEAPNSEAPGNTWAQDSNGESTENTPSVSEATLPENGEPVPKPNPYKDVFLKNQDMAGWLKIEGTKIDYPVMQTMEDENYYLERGFDKKSNKNGCLILDTDSSVTEPVSTNQIIHGHNMKSGEMFGTLTEYENQDFFIEHPVISLYTKDCERRYEVTAVFRSQVYRKTDEVFKFYKFFQADTEEEFNDFYDNIKSMSLYDTGVTASFGDKFLTLSTCVYHVENGRFVVVAKEIEPGESYEPLE